MQTFNDNKAGLSGLDKERIQKIIDENTSSTFDEHARKRQERITSRIQNYRRLISTLTQQQIIKAQSEMDELVESLENERDLSRIALHVDMDAFYAAVEMRDDPTLRNIPMAVGSESMLSTSNYVARQFGVRSAMPGFIARKLCPELKIVPCNFHKYRAVSAEVRKIFHEYNSNFQMGSLDEAYLDITEYVSKRSQRVRLPRVRYSGDCLCRLPRVLDSDKDQLDSATTSEAFCEKCGRKRIRVDDFVCFGTEVDQIVSEMRFRVEQLTGLTCSAGIAPNFMIAKVCSDFNKPNGQFRIENDRQSVMEFMQELPLRKVSGIGAVTEAILKGIGIQKCGELYEKRAVLSLLFTRCSLEHFLRIALGISVSHTAQNTSSKRKSISVERTFHPTADLHLLIKILEDLCNDLIDSLLEHHIRGGYSATVKCKFSTFDVITRCVSVDYLLNEKNALFKICEKIVRNEIKQHNHLHIRLLGVRLSRLIFVDDKVDKVKSLTSFWSTSDTNEQSTMNNANGGVTLDKQKPLNDGMETNQEKIHESDERHSNDAKTDASVSISKAALSTQPCPVCGDQLPDQLAMVNRHLDECLNRQAIAELQNEVGEVGGSGHIASRKRPSEKNVIPSVNGRSPHAGSINAKKKYSIRDYFSPEKR